MILKIILLILILLALSLLITFIFYVLQPSIAEKVNITENLLVNVNEASQYFTEKKSTLKKNKTKAFVIHQSKIDIHTQALNFNSKFTCKMIKSLYFADEVYKYVCLGFGDCQKICTQQAIVIKNNVATVMSSCCGCGRCEHICPQKIIKMLPKNTKELPAKIFPDTVDFEKEIEDNKIEKIVEWKDKKDFKIWSYCYKIFKKLNF